MSYATAQRLLDDASDTTRILTDHDFNAHVVQLNTQLLADDAAESAKLETQSAAKNAKFSLLETFQTVLSTLLPSVTRRNGGLRSELDSARASGNKKVSLVRDVVERVSIGSSSWISTHASNYRAFLNTTFYY